MLTRNFFIDSIGVNLSFGYSLNNIALLRILVLQKVPVKKGPDFINTQIIIHYKFCHYDSQKCI